MRRRTSCFQQRIICVLENNSCYSTSTDSLGRKPKRSVMWCEDSRDWICFHSFSFQGKKKERESVSHFGAAQKNVKWKSDVWLPVSESEPVMWPPHCDRQKSEQSKRGCRRSESRAEGERQAARGSPVIWAAFVPSLWWGSVSALFTLWQKDYRRLDAFPERTPRAERAELMS